MDRYVSERLARGDAPESISRDLLLVGWNESDVKDSVARGLIAHGVPTPEAYRMGGGRTASTVDVVVNFFSFILLAIVATAFGVLYYQIINAFFPDPLQVTYGSYDASRSAMHYAMAALFIGFPIFVLVVRLWFRRFLSEEGRVESKLSKWLTYLVLLVAAVGLVGDLITTIFFLLQGEVTIRFFLKALTVFVIFATIFGFYFIERRVVQYRDPLPPLFLRSFFFGVSVLVLLGVVLGFVVGGSPSTERARGLDTQRAQDLMTLSGCVAEYSRTYARLPETLDDLNKSTGYVYCASNMLDPETRVPYEYRVLVPSRERDTVTEAEFELCAVFTLDSTKEDALPAKAYSSPKSKWSLHAAGRECDPETVVLKSALPFVSEGGSITPIPVY